MAINFDYSMDSFDFLNDDVKNFRINFLASMMWCLRFVFRICVALTAVPNRCYNFKYLLVTKCKFVRVRFVLQFDSIVLYPFGWALFFKVEIRIAVLRCFSLCYGIKVPFKLNRLIFMNIWRLIIQFRKEYVNMFLC